MCVYVRRIYCFLARLILLTVFGIRRKYDRIGENLYEKKKKKLYMWKKL